MNAMFELLPTYSQDSPEWHEARRAGIGASEVAAILGLAPEGWGFTPLSVYRYKMGAVNDIPENLAYFGHALEEPIARWVTDKHPEVGTILPGIAARSVPWPWLTATPDRLTDEGRIPVELKTSSAFGRDKWRNGVPLYYQAQVQTQLAVLDAPFGWLAVLHGGNDPELYRVERDEEFITGILVPRTREFWEQHVLAQVPPEPMTLTEQALVWPSQPGSEVELSDTAFEAFQRWQVLSSDIAAQDAERDQLKAVIGQYVETAETLTYGGVPVATYKSRPGRRTVSVSDAEREAPHLIRQGQPFKVLASIKEKK